MKGKQYRYQPRSPLQAIDPKAFLGLFMELEDPENDYRDDATIVTIRGPLSQHSDWREDSYEAIRSRVDDACRQSAPTVVLRIDSPGGDVAGLFDTASAIRKSCKIAGKQLVVHIEGQCCSAAYALATASDRIVASRTAEVGSIGVIAARLDESRALEDQGIKISLIKSGKRKADGNTYAPMSDAELDAYQDHIDALAKEFFDTVALRRGVSAQSIAALEAATFRGQAALDTGLVDELGSFDQTLSSLGATEVAGEAMDEKEKEAREALAAIAEDEERDEEARAKARRALAALDAEDEDDDESAEDEEESAEDDEKREDEDDDESAEDEDDDEKAQAAGSVSATTAGSLAAQSAKLERRLARLERQNESMRRKQLIAAHGGVTSDLAKLLASKPLAEVKAILSALPKPRKAKLGDAAATIAVGGTRGKNQGNKSRLPADQSRDMAKAMGMAKTKYGVVKKGNVQILGASLDEGGES
ncbi:MAG: S49 family peptidase [Propionibacteriaceae bacterium]|nr:S49 family peptidase [Propionibacteriaceae bacterium]